MPQNFSSSSVLADSFFSCFCKPTLQSVLCEQKSWFLLQHLRHVLVEFAQGSSPNQTKPQCCCKPSSSARLPSVLVVFSNPALIFRQNVTMWSQNGQQCSSLSVSWRAPSYLFTVTALEINGSCQWSSIPPSEAPPVSPRQGNAKGL